jgi:hypothetical protein
MCVKGKQHRSKMGQVPTRVFPVEIAAVELAQRTA